MGMLAQAKGSEEKAKRAMLDAARLADELRAEQNHSTAQGKAKRALETQISEVELRLTEANEVATKLQQKIRTYKKQIEEAEEIAALNLAKYRKAQQDLEENEERGKMAGATLQLTH